MSSDGFLLIDVGGSHWRADLRINGERRSAAATALPPIAQGLLSPIRVRNGLNEITAQLKMKDASPSVVAMATTGMARLPGDIDQLHNELRISGSVIGTLIISDAAAGLAGALSQLRDGCLLSVGTGVAAVARSSNGEWSFKDGWGPLLGDEGGGYWIGSAGLRAALRARDHRSGGSSRLTELAVQQFGEDTRLWPLRGDLEATVQRIASFSTQVLASASAGDDVSGTIVDEARSRLLETAAAISLGDEVHVSGGMMKDLLFRRSLFEGAEAIGLHLKEAEGGALSGLGLLDRVGVDPLVTWAGDLASYKAWT